MKKLFITLLLLISLTSLSQNQSFLEESHTFIKNNVDTTSALESVKNVESLFVHYFKEATEGSKALVGSKRIKRKFIVDNLDAIDYNEDIDKDTTFYRKDKKILYTGNFYHSMEDLLLCNAGVYLSYIGGAYLILTNIMSFIKVTFFSKLYLVELLLKYV